MDLCVLRKTLFSSFSIHSYLLYLDVFFAYFLIDYKIERMVNILEKHTRVYPPHTLTVIYLEVFRKRSWGNLGLGKGLA